MIVYLNEKAEKIEVYTEQGRKEYFFDEIEYFLDDMGNQKCQYVINIIDTNIQMVIDTVKSIQPNSSISGSLDKIDSNVNFLHSTISGVLQISLGEGGTLSFNGTGDCKILDERLYQLIKDVFDIRQMIKQGKLEIISESEMRKYVRISNRDQAKKDRRWAAKEAKEIDSIIVNNDIPGSAVALAEKGGIAGDPDDIVVVDINEGSIPAGQSPRKVSEEDILSGRADPADL